MCWLQQSAQLWSYPTFLLVPLIVIACIECFAGYRAWRFLLVLNGAVLGFIGGAMLAVFSGAAMMLLIGAVAGAIAGGFLFACAVRLGSFVFAFGSVTSLTMILAHGARVPSEYVLPMAGAAGLAGALAATASCRPFMIAVAAIAGAQQVASAWHAYRVPYGSPPLAQDAASEPAVFIALAAIGLLVQCATSIWLQSTKSDARTCGSGSRATCCNQSQLPPPSPT